MNTPEGVPQEEFYRYWDIFQEANYFAAIKAGGECLDKDLAATLRTLHGYNLYPVVVHGGGNSIDEALRKEGVEWEKIDGIRKTPPNIVPIVEKALKRVNTDFVAQVNQNKKAVYAEGFNGIFYVDKLDQGYGCVGEVSDMDQESIDACLKRGHIPVTSCLGVYHGGDSEYACFGGYVNTNGDVAFSFVVRNLRPKKVIILTGVGGVFKGDRLISDIRRDELDSIIRADFVNGGMKVKLEKARELVDEGFDVQITNPGSLILELFSSKGCGTYIRG